MLGDVVCPDTAVLQCCSDTVTLLVAAHHDTRGLNILMATLAPTGDWGPELGAQLGLINGHIVWLPRLRAWAQACT